MTTALATAEKALNDRLAELDAEAQSLSSEQAKVRNALQALGAQARPSARRREPQQSAASSPRGARAKRAPRGQRRNQVLAYLKDNAPARPIEIASHLEVSANQVHGLLAKLREDKLVKKTAKGYGLVPGATS